jgi:hypothetical protein
MSENFEADLSRKSSDKAERFSRKKNICPDCKEVLLEEYLEQNPFPEVPCPSCGTLIKSSSLHMEEMPSENQRIDNRCDATLKVQYISYDKFITQSSTKLAQW